MSFNIVYDYRFDTSGFYDDPAVRAVLQYAAEIWSGYIGDDFATVQAGTTFSISNPNNTGTRETITLEQDIDDIVIFVGAAPIAALGNAGYTGTDASGDIFHTRVSDDFRGTGAVSDFEPWAGVMTLNSTANWSTDLDGPVADHNDMLTTVLHEIGHVLGVGTSATFTALIEEGHFTGVNAMVANGGEDVPLDTAGGHVAQNHTGEDGAETLLDPTSTVGTRALPSRLDLAMLADIGYEIEGFEKQGTTPDIATAGSDTIYGSVLGDTLDGLDGNDQIQGHEGGDLLYGGTGSDTLFGQWGDDTLDGGDGMDLVLGQDGDDLLHGGAGDDQLQGNEGHDTLRGGTQNDTLFGQQGNDWLSGDAGDDFLIGDGGDDTLDGGAGNDSIRAGDGADVVRISLGMGSDTVFDFSFSQDRVDVSALDEAARDALTVTGSGDLQRLHLSDGSVLVLQDTSADTDRTLKLIVGAQDQVAGTPVQEDSPLETQAEVDGTPEDPLVSEDSPQNNAPEGRIILTGTPEPGTLLGVDTGTLVDADGLGDFTYQWLRDGIAIAGATDAGYVPGDADAYAMLQVVLSYVDGQGTAESLTSDEVQVSPQALVLTAGNAATRLEGGAGHDILTGGQGNDTLIGGAGDDRLTGGQDADDLSDMIYGGAGDDTIHGGHGNDALRGDAGHDVIAGGFGADTLIGGSGDDRLTGSALGDMIFGGDGDDFINGGFGYDLINGGAGADGFFHLGVADHGSDWIQDFTGSEGDVLIFGQPDARAGDFQVNFAFTPGAGQADVADAFVIYQPTGQIVWALVDGDAQDIALQIGADVFIF